jgi:hypothetical protein
VFVVKVALVFVIHAERAFVVCKSVYVPVSPPATVKFGLKMRADPGGNGKIQTRRPLLEKAAEIFFRVRW